MVFVEVPKINIDAETGIFVESKQSEKIEKKGNNFANKQDNSKRIVKTAIDGFPLASENDLNLCIEFWKISNQAKVSYSKGELIVRFDINSLKEGKITMPETISRLRRQLYEEGEIDYTEKTKANRQKAEEDYKSYYSQ